MLLKNVVCKIVFVTLKKRRKGGWGSKEPLSILPYDSSALVLGAIRSHSHIWVHYLCEVPFQAKSVGYFSIFFKAMIKTSVSGVLTTTSLGAIRCPPWKKHLYVSFLVVTPWLHIFCFCCFWLVYTIVKADIFATIT